MTTRIHHLNCATITLPLGGMRGLLPPRLVAHCLLVEGADGLTLVDTGFGSGDVADPSRLGPGTARMFGGGPRQDETAVERIRSLGLDPADVRDVVVTHLDLDHAGGLGDFPRASVHVFGDELDAARARATRKEQGRYIEAQWAHGPHWVEHSAAGGEEWFGFDAVTVVGEDVALVPLPGHTRGHCAVAVRRPGGDWFLHCGDAYFSAGEKERPPTCPGGLRFFQSVVQMDASSRKHNQERLRALHADHGDRVHLFSAHDAAEFEALATLTT